MKTQTIHQQHQEAYTAHDHVRPEWIRLPKPGQRCLHSGLSRSTLNELTIPSPVNDFRPPVKSAVLKKRGAMRGIRLISYDSLMGYIDSLCVECEEAIYEPLRAAVLEEGQTAPGKEVKK